MYIFVYILKKTKSIMMATIPAQGIMVMLALLTGFTKFGTMPGGGLKAGIFDKSAPSGYNERSIDLPIRKCQLASREMECLKKSSYSQDAVKA